MLRGLFLLPLSNAPAAIPPAGIEAVTAGWRPALFIYSFLWVAVGIQSCIAAFRKRDALACALLFGLCGVWGIGYLFGGLYTWWGIDHPWQRGWFGLDLARREWQSAASYLGLALLGGYWSRMVNPSRLQREAAEGVD
jgi:hypothetical protein